MRRIIMAEAFVRYRRTALLAIVAAILLCANGACRKQKAPPAKPKTTADIIRECAENGFTDSIVPVTRSLAKESVFVATESSLSTVPANISPENLRLKVVKGK